MEQTQAWTELNKDEVEEVIDAIRHGEMEGELVEFRNKESHLS